jgi:uncharacterized protein with PIN domain
MATCNHSVQTRVAEFRFYEELNDFLAAHRRKRAFHHAFSGTPSVKDTIEAIGVPHTEVDLILVDGESVDFARRLHGGERVAVYPVFERFDISPLARLKARPLRETRFVLDVHLGKLARHLRLLGFDALYRNDYDDPTLVSVSVNDKRILLTRDVGLLKNGALTHAYWLREKEPRLQLAEILRVFDLKRALRPFSRCLECNAELADAGKERVIDRVPTRVSDDFDKFAECLACQRVYWRGSHYERMRVLIENVRAEAPDAEEFNVSSRA